MPIQVNVFVSRLGGRDDGLGEAPYQAPGGS